MPYLQPGCVFLQKGTLRAFSTWKVNGRENVPPMGPLIIVANHQSNFDPSLLACSIPRTIRFLAKENIFGNPIASWFLYNYGAHPLNREGLDIAAYRWALDRLSHDEALVLFPEGTRNPGSMGHALPGVTRIALQTQAPILPVGITGSERLKGLLRHFNPTGKLTVNIGTPFSLPIIEGKPDKAVVNSMTHMIMERIAALLPEEYRGEYRERLKAPRGAAGPASLSARQAPAGKAPSKEL
jgi:1-acyl-sn-glycerol-3-phosphate acyltransferase